MVASVVRFAAFALALAILAQPALAQRDPPQQDPSPEPPPPGPLAPVASFDVSPESPNVSENVTFLDLSYDIDGAIVRWQWAFGDGNGSELRSPVHRYESEGPVNVTLVVIDATGLSATAAREIVVNALPPEAQPEPVAGAPTDATPAPSPTPGPPEPAHRHEIVLAFQDAAGRPLAHATAVLRTEGEGDTILVADARGSVVVRLEHSGMAVVVIDGEERRLDPHGGDVALQASGVVAPESDAPRLAIVIVAAAALLALGGFAALLVRRDERLYWRFLVVLSPLFTRLARDEILDQDVREAIYRHIEGEPGVHLTAIKRALSLHNGTALHHLRHLETNGYVHSAMDGRLRRFFVTGVAPRFEGAPPLVDAVLAFVAQHPGTTNARVAAALGKRPTLVSYHVQRLAQAGRLAKEPAGREQRLFVRMERS